MRTFFFFVFLLGTSGAALIGGMLIAYSAVLGKNNHSLEAQNYVIGAWTFIITWLFCAGITAALHLTKRSIRN